MHLNSRFTALFVGCVFCLSSQAQLSRLGEDVQYGASISGQGGSGDNAPFWQTANRFGLGNNKNNSGFARVYIKRDTENDSLYRWRMGYGADLVAPINYKQHFIVQQAYAELQIWDFRISLGQKERYSELKNPLLSTGGMTMGMNARPIPQLRLEFPDFYAFKFTKEWIAIKGHLAYGMFTDNHWQQDFTKPNVTAPYTKNLLYHSKAGFIRIGNTDKFPLVLTGGLEMMAQFGGRIWNLRVHNQPDDSYKCGSGIADYFKALIPTGSDATDEDNPNVAGNHLGSYLARLTWQDKTWNVSVYGEHFFEDHGQMGFKFAWKDMLYGAEINLPKNPVVSTIVYEHMRTTDQSGPILSCHGEKVPYIGGLDDYYNHGLYGCYQHAGHTMGTPLIISPMYNTNNTIATLDNRITAHHVGLTGKPHSCFSYRVLFTHEKSWGTYKLPHTNPHKGDFLLVETTYSPQRIKGLGITASYGMNHGDLLNKSHGGMLTVSYSGWINPTY